MHTLLYKETYAMQKVNRKMAKIQMLYVPFEHRVELFKKSVEFAKKRFLIDISAGYIHSCDDYHVVLTDRADAKNEVYYDTLTQEEY